MNNWIYIAVMFAVSYAIRILPLKTSSFNRSCTMCPMSHWQS